MRDYAKSVLKKYLPTSINDSNFVDKERLFKEFKSRYGVFPVVSKINSIDDLYKDAEIRTTSILRGKIISEMLDVDKSHILGNRRTTEILKSDEYITDINGKIKNKYNQEFSLFMKSNLLKKFDSSMNDKRLNLTENPAKEQEMIRNSILILTAEQGVGNRVYDTYADDAKKNILEKFPNCTKNGEIDFEKLNVEYKEYMKYISEVTKIDFGEYGDDIVKDEWKKFKDIQKNLFRQVEMKQDPNRLKRYKEELKTIAVQRKHDHKQNEEKAIYEFIAAVTKGRNERSSKVLQPETTQNYSELFKRVDKRLKNRIGDDANYKAYTENVRKSETDPKAFKVFAREAKLTFVRSDAIDLIGIISTKKDDVSQTEKEDAIKKVFDYFVGTKRDLDESPVTDKDNTHKVRRINYLMKKIAPEVFEDGKVNEDKLLVKYNEVFGTNIENVDDMFQIVEDKLLGKYASKLIEAIDKGEGYNGQYAHPLVGRNFFRRINEEKNAAKANKTPKVTDKEMKKVMDRQAEEIVVDPTALQKTNAGKKVERKDLVDSQVISGKDIAAAFEANAVELGGEESKKVEQHVEMAPKTVQAESMEVSSDVHNYPVEQPKKGFFSSIIDTIKNGLKNGLKNVKEKIFGVTDNNTGTGTTDNNNTTGTTSGTGGVNKDEQDVMNLTGHGKINLTFGTPATVGEDDKKSKSMDSVEIVEQGGEEK